MCVLKRSANELNFPKSTFWHFFSKFSDFGIFRIFGDFRKFLEKRPIPDFSRGFSRNRLYLRRPKTGKNFFPGISGFPRRPGHFRIFSEKHNFDQFYTNFNDVYTAAQSGFIKTRNFPKSSDVLKFRKFRKKFSRNRKFPRHFRNSSFPEIPFPNFQFSGFLEIILPFIDSRVTYTYVSRSSNI
jgi:hypothetical protein